MKILEKVKDARFIKNLLFTTVLGGLSGILNYVFNIIVARYTDSSIFAIFSASMAIIYLLQIPVTGIITTVTKVVGEKRGYDLNRFKWRALGFFVCIGVLLSTVFFFSRDIVATVSSLPEDVFIYLTIILFFAFISPVSKGILLGRERIFLTNILIFGETVLKLIFGIIAIKLGGNIPLLILANGIPSILTTIFVIPLTKLDGEKLKEDVHINYKELILTVISFLLLSAPYTLDLILVNPTFRAEYSAVSLLGKLVYFGGVTIASVMFARLANLSNWKDERRTLFIAVLGTILIGLGITFALYLFRDTIISATIGDQYLSIARYIPLFGICMTGYAVVYMVANYFISIGKFRYIYFLVFLTGLQIYLFSVRNSSLLDVVINQVIIYSSLTVFTLFYLFLIFKNERYTQKGINKEQEIN